MGHVFTTYYLDKHCRPTQCGKLRQEIEADIEFDIEHGYGYETPKELALYNIERFELHGNLLKVEYKLDADENVVVTGVYDTERY